MSAAKRLPEDRAAADLLHLESAIAHVRSSGRNPTPEELAAWGRAIRGLGEPTGMGRKPSTPASIIAEWRSEGPLVHEPTGFPTLDELTGGGPVYGSRWYVAGAPDAGKTAFIVQVADDLEARGVVIGLHLVDEDPGDVVARILQRRGFTRASCEDRVPETLDMMERAVAKLRIRIYDGSWTIEAAMADLAAYAAELGARAAFFSDSLQTVESDAEQGVDSLREQVTARVRAYRAGASRYRMIVFATSEMGRGFYRSVEAAEASDDMASAKESGAVEYSARVLLSLRSVKGEPDLLELRIAKNKHGPRGERISLRIDRARQTIAESGDDLPSVEPTERREQARAKAGHASNLQAAVALVGVLLADQGMSSRAVAPKLRAALGSCGKDRADAALELLGPAVYRVDAPNRRQRVYLDVRQLPEPVYHALAPNLRTVVDGLAQRAGEARDAAE